MSVKILFPKEKEKIVLPAGNAKYRLHSEGFIFFIDKNGDEITRTVFTPRDQRDQKLHS